MSRMQKLIDTLTGSPTPKDFGWGDLVKVMRHFGYLEHEGAGSRKRFVNKIGHKIVLHKRHPDSTLLEYQIRQIIEALTTVGLLP